MKCHYSCCCPIFCSCHHLVINICMSGTRLWRYGDQYMQWALLAEVLAWCWDKAGPCNRNSWNQCNFIWHPLREKERGTHEAWWLVALQCLSRNERQRLRPPCPSIWSASALNADSLSVERTGNFCCPSLLVNAVHHVLPSTMSIHVLLSILTLRNILILLSNQFLWSCPFVDSLLCVSISVHLLLCLY